MANDYLKRLRQATETILRDAYEHRNDILSREAVNWADLHCVAVLRVVDDEDRTSYRVEIEEVAPDASDLQQFVHQKLEVAGFFNIEVHTKW